MTRLALAALALASSLAFVSHPALAARAEKIGGKAVARAPEPETRRARAVANVADFEGAISEGDFSVSVDSGLALVLPNKGDSTVKITLGGEYFFKDAVSAGGLIDIENTAGTNALAIGPTGSYYFYHKDRFSVAGHAAFLLANYAPKTGDSLTYFQFRIGASADYFITRNVAIGPEAQMRFIFGSDKLTRNFEFALLGRFALFF